MKDSEADDDRLDEKEDGVEFVIAFVSRDRSGNQTHEKKRIADDVLRSQLKKMGDAFEKRVNDIDWSEHSEEDEEGAMVSVIVRFIVN
jgi:hypothetical protein